MKFVKQVNIVRYKRFKYDICKYNIYLFENNFILEEGINFLYFRRIIYYNIIFGYFIIENIF